MANKQLIGMVHLPALPGAPRAQLSLDAIEAQAVDEARVLRAAGFDACVIENFGDNPFHKDAVEPVTIAAMSRIVGAVRRAEPAWRVGVNVLRNDARAALAIAAATGAHFVRVNVHVGATATDQGVIEGRAAETLRLRRTLGAQIEIWSDVHVKHGRSLAHDTIEREAEDTVRRGMADAVIVSGTGTGHAARLEDVRAVTALALGAPVFVGSGVTVETVAAVLRIADGVIVGTALKAGGATTAALDPERLRRFVDAARSGSER
jgi:membrane complex biogenesis BtpA family protein